MYINRITKYAALILILCLSSTLLKAQQNTLQGIISDSASGIPIVNVNIRADDGKGIRMIVTTDSTGYFSLAVSDTGWYILRTSHISYQDTVLHIYCDGSVMLHIILAPEQRFLETLEVYCREKIDDHTVCKYPGVETKRCITYTIKRIVTEKITGDIRSVIALKMPLVYSREFGDDGLLYIAGSRSYATKYYIDNIEVIGDMKLPTKAISDITVYSFGIPAKYGDVTGGVIEINTKNAR